MSIGNRGDSGASPTLGDRCEVGAGAVLIGPISVGADAKIGAGSVVVKDVPEGTTAVGNPARIVRQVAQ
ncbi:DapH/DapD/GlmU-related protein [Microbacterium sp. zg-YB36]|uniref:serine O-acetyltransferase n=1 Tax=Microbacterium sp. zg-YB36 TaxID=2969407 RepID=UPI003364EA49